MRCTVCVFLVGVVFCSRAGVQAAVTSVPKPAAVSILAAIKQDNEVCNGLNMTHDSRFVTNCDKLKYPSADTILTPANSEQFLCLGFYDRIIRLCYLESFLTDKSFLPSNTTELDADVEKTLPKNDEDVRAFCGNWHSKDYPPKYNKTLAFVEQLEKTLKGDIECIQMCTEWGTGKFVPVCAILAKMDALSKEIAEHTLKKEMEKGKTKEQTKTQEPAKESADKNIGEAKNDKTQTAKPDASAAKAPVENEKKSEAAPAEAKQPEGDSKKAKSSETKAETAAAAADPAKDKQAAKVKTDEEGQTEKQVKKAQEPKKEEAKDAKADSSVPSVNAAAPNKATSGKDLEADTMDALLDDPKNVISEHTQDNPDAFADGQPSDAGDAPDAVDDDVDQNSAQPQEKPLGYIHRLPSLPNEDDSHFFSYLIVTGVICIAGYVGYYSKQKILAMVLEGRRSRGGRRRRRPSTANYRKLDCTLEEAVTSQCNSNVTHVIY